MSLGIFSFDLAAIINSLSNFIDISDAENLPAADEISLTKTEDVLQNASLSDSVIDDVLMAAALTSAVTSVISTSAEAAKSDIEKPASSKPASRTTPTPLDEETRKEIERLIKSLQTSIIHNYKSSDLIAETVSLNTVTNFAKRKPFKESDDNREALQHRKKRDEQRFEMLREELKKAILKNNSGV